MRKLPSSYVSLSPILAKNQVDSLIKYLPILILAVYVLLSIASFWMSPERALIDAFDDDAYYYFKIARNIVEKERLTFDGKSIANGFHPLWLIILIPFFAIWDDPVLVLRVVGTFSVVLAGLTGYLGLHYASRYSLLSYIMAAALILACIVSFVVTGMEATLVLPLLVVALIVLGQTKPWRSSPETKSIAALGLVLSMVQLARLDAVFLNLAILLFVALKIRTLRHARKLVILGWFPLATGTLYVIINYSVFGHIIPTSGLAKSMQNETYRINQKFLGQLIAPNNPVDGMLWIVFLGMFLLSAGYIAFLLFTKLKTPRTPLPESAYLPVIVASFFVAFTLYQILGTSWVLWRWYAYPVLLMGVFVLPYISEQVERHLKKYRAFSFPLCVMTFLFVPVAIVLIFTISLRRGYWSKSAEPSFKYENYLVAEILNKELLPPVMFAMGDRAGSFAYFFNGNVLQLEGLVGDYQLVEAIENNTLMDYMSEFGVEYVMSYIEPPPHYSQWILLTPLPKLSSGPHAEIILCKQTEFLRIQTQYTAYYIWKWPSCERQIDPRREF